MLQTFTPPAHERLRQIEQARQLVLHEGAPVGGQLADSWIEGSWRRCLGRGQRPEQQVVFDALPKHAFNHIEEANHALVEVARPVMEKLARTIANTHYFAILTNSDGVVVDVSGPVDRRDRRANLIARVGVDLSEKSVGTTAISAALSELRPVWLHRGEHFYRDTSVYSCAGAPLFGPDGLCVGMLDLTGVDAVERPELKHLVVQSARSIENALTLQQPHTLRLRLNWPGCALGEETDGLLGLDGDGYVTAANRAARIMLPQLGVCAGSRVHSRDLFALPFEMLFDTARHEGVGFEAPLWSGLRLGVQARMTQGRMACTAWSKPSASAQRPVLPGGSATLKQLEQALIRTAVNVAGGNVAEAARSLGISRATVYRKVARKPAVPAPKR